MDYLFERQSGSWYLTGLTESETKAESTESTPAANVPEPMAESDVQDAILAAATGSDSDSAEADGTTLQTRGVDTQASERPPTAPRHRRTKAQPARRHNTKQKYRIQGRCFVSGIFYLRSNFTITSRYHRYGTMFQIIHSSIRM